MKILGINHAYCGTTQGRKQNILQSHLELIDVFIDAVYIADLNVKVMDRFFIFHLLIHSM